MSPFYKTRRDWDSQLLSLIMGYKTALDSRLDNDFLTDMARFWVLPSDAINNKISILFREMEEIRNSGKELDIQWIREFQYYKDLQNQIDDEMNIFAKNVLYYTERERTAQIGQSVEMAEQAISSSYNEIVPNFFNRLGVTEFENLAMLINKTSPLKELLSTMGSMTGAAVGAKLQEGLAMGLPLLDIARNMTDISDIGFQRAMLISRTEILRAHRLSTLQSYQASGAVTKYKRIANKRTACMGCLLLDGEEFTIQEQFTDHPNGACAMVPVVKGAPEPYWEKGLHYFTKLPESDQRARMGNSYFESWKAGKFKLKDLAGYYRNPKWGDNPGVAPLWKLEGYKSYADKLAKLAEARKARKAARIAGATVQEVQPWKGVNLGYRTYKELLTDKASTLFQKTALTKINDKTLKGAIKDALKTLDDMKLNIPKRVGVKKYLIKIYESKTTDYNGVYHRGDNKIGLSVANLAKLDPAKATNTVLHEFGHFFDNKVIGGGDSFWSETKAADSLMNLLSNSKAMQIAKGNYAKNYPDHFEYLERRREMFARAFSQWTHIRTNPTLTTIYDTFDETRLGYQWYSDDFKPIAALFDKLFGDMGIL